MFSCKLKVAKRSKTQRQPTTILPKLLSSIVQKIYHFLPFQRAVWQQNYSLALKTLRGTDVSPAFVSGSDACSGGLSSNSRIISGLSTQTR